MTQDFETFTREKIARFRADADALEKILKEYQSAMARATGATRRGSGEGSAFGAVMQAIEEAGTGGLTLDEMIQAAADEGHEVKRNTLRSQVWQAKQDGRLEQMAAGRYRVPGAADSAPTQPQPDPEPDPDERVFKPRPTGPREDFPLDEEIPF